MKVLELIELLQKYDDDAEVAHYIDDFGTVGFISDVSMVDVALVRCSEDAQKRRVIVEGHPDGVARVFLT